MKIKKRFAYSFLPAILLVIVGPNVSGQSDRLEEEFTWTESVRPGMEFRFNNYNCDIELHRSDNNEIKYVLSVDAKLDSPEDADKLRKQFERLDLQVRGNRIEFNNSYYQSSNETPFRKNMELRTGDKIRYSDIDIKGILYVPKEVDFMLDTKYSVVEMEDLGGDFKLKSYNDKIYAGNVDGKLDIDAKYSSLNFGNTGDMELTLYNCRLNAGRIGNYKARDSKYSTIEFESAGDVSVTAFNDKYYLEKTGNLVYDAKYTDLQIEEAGNVDITMYDGEIEIDKADDVELDTKYSGYELGEVSDLSIRLSYSDKYRLGTVESIQIQNTKYSTYHVDRLNRGVEVEESYSDKFTVSSSGPACRGMKIAAKYAKIEFSVLPSLDYRLVADLRYSTLGLDESKLDIRKRVEKGPNLEMEALKGREKPDMAVFNLSGYDLSFRFSD